jgi:NACalpha-BTF3-like transcription factor
MKEEEKKADPEVINATKIIDVMESTRKSKREVITALMSCDWDPNSACMKLIVEEP